MKIHSVCSLLEQIFPVETLIIFFHAPPFLILPNGQLDNEYVANCHMHKEKEEWKDVCVDGGQSSRISF